MRLGDIMWKRILVILLGPLLAVLCYYEYRSTGCFTMPLTDRTTCGEEVGISMVYFLLALLGIGWPLFSFFHYYMRKGSN